MVNPDFWRRRRVFITGHTGFKGGWLSLWLKRLNAELHGFSLAPPTDPNFYSISRVGELTASERTGDVRNASSLIQAMQDVKPEVVFHLAAQPLVRYSYRNPVETYAVNVMGTVHLLEAVRATPGVRAVILVATDKCYENREWLWGYRENDPVGGFDPYSSSKACAELVASAYRRSFFDQKGAALASVRAGNVIGGGDWGADRLIPDILRSDEQGAKLRIRSPEAVRPWQHVLAPLAGYIQLAERLSEEGGAFAEAWNFGPEDGDAKPVRWIVERLAAALPKLVWEVDDSSPVHEAAYLRLDSSKAKIRLGWRSKWRLETAVDKTLEWRAAWRGGCDMQDFSLNQIAEYESAEGSP